MTIAHKTKLSALVVALMVAAATLLVPPSSATAGDGAVSIVGTAHLSDGIGSSTNQPGCLGGLAAGFHGTDVAAASNGYAGFTYNNDQVTGDAQGNILVEATAGNAVEVGFDWLRVGAVAIVTFDPDEKSGHTGIGVAAFAPVDVPAVNFDCHPTRTDKNYGHGSWSGNYEHAQVVGVGVINHVAP